MKDFEPRPTGDPDQFGRICAGILQSLGIVLVLIGAYFIISVLVTAIALLSSSDQMAAAVTSMAHAIDGEKMVIEIDQRDLPVGKLIALALILMLCMIAGALSIALINAGSRLVMRVFQDRSDHRQLLRDVADHQLQLVRQLDTMAPPETSTTRTTAAARSQEPAARGMS